MSDSKKIQLEMCIEDLKKSFVEIRERYIEHDGVFEYALKCVDSETFRFLNLASK